MTGNTAAVDPALFEGLDGVEQAIRVTRPYKLASREMKKEDTRLTIAGAEVGPTTFTVVAGPCSCESEALVMLGTEAKPDAKSS
jgi:3-deoxy-7-phosphoheptulonate synthase